MPPVFTKYICYAIINKLTLFYALIIKVEMLMENQVNNVNSNKTTVFLTVMTLLAGLITAILFQTGLLIVPFTAGFLACVFLFECGKKRRLTYILPVLLIAFDLIFNGIFSLNCLASVLVAAVIYLSFVKLRAKSECAVYLTIIISAFTVISFILLGFFMVNDFSISAVREFYIEQTELIRTEFIRAFSSLAMENGEGELEYLFSEADLNYLFDSTFKTLVAFFAILGFAISGVALKVFTFFGVRKSQFAERLPSYTFKTSNLFAYFYVLLVVASMFIGEPITTAALTIHNLHTVFMFVYAYLGYKYVTEIFARKNGKPILSGILVLCAVLFFSSFAVQILSYFGAFMTIVRNRVSATHGNNENNDINN